MKNTIKWMPNRGKELPLSFYDRSDVVQIAKDLLGKELATCFNGIYTSGIIVETEAYAGAIDRASHAYGNRFTKRTATLYQTPGTVYVYLCYGLHHLFNIVTAPEKTPHAVLVRAIEPLMGIEEMCKRRGKQKPEPSLTAGPGVMSAALAIKTKHTDSLLGEDISVKEAWQVKENQIMAGSRVGVAYAQDHAFWPYRFWIKNNPFVSKGKGL